MPKTESKNNFWNILTREEPPDTVWGEDWTKKFNPNDLMPGTLLVDPPYPNVGERRLTKEDVLKVINRPPLTVEKAEFKELAARIGIPETELVCVSVARVCRVHNERTKFGNRTVIVVTPAIVNKDRFVGNENLILYFLYEQNLGIAEYLPRLFTVKGLSPTQLEEIFQRAKTQAMKYALYKGDLPAYLAFHDSVYPASSPDPDVLSQYRMRIRAFEAIAREYTPPFFNLVSGLLGLLKQPRPNTYQVWQRQMRKKGFSFNYLNKPIK